MLGFDEAAYVGSGSGTWGVRNYTAPQVLGWISDLQPTTSYRYTGIVRAQDADTTLGSLTNYPSGDTSGWANKTVLEFLQAYVDTMQSPVAVYPRLSWDLDGNNAGGGQAVLQIAQEMFEFQQMLDPPFAMLSIDNFQITSSVESTLQNLYSQGWQGLSLGACGIDPSNPNLSEETWGFLCLDSNGNPVDPSYASETLGEIETKWDDPGGTDHLMSNYDSTNDDATGVAQVIENAAKQQSTLGSNVHLAYPVFQVGKVMSCHAAGLVCKSAGDYWNAGDTLLTAIANMMNQYNVN
jgi:hypothetical protein